MAAPSGKAYRESKRISRQVSTKSVYNPANSLYNKLTRFFSGPITKYKTPDISNPTRQTAMKQRHHDIFQTPFKREDDYFLINQYQAERNVEVMRLERYMDFETMVMNPPEIAKALDIYASEITCYTEMSPILKIISPKDEIKEILTTLFYDTLNIEMNAFGWVRTLCQFGDCFLFLDIDPELGIIGIKALPVRDIQRLEGEDPSNPNYVQFQWNAQGLTFENVEIAHFRILGSELLYPYGDSILSPARRITKQLNLMVENMITYRVVRSAERLAFYMDVTGMEPDKVEAYFEQNLSKMKRQSVIDPNTGRLDMRYNASCISLKTKVFLQDGRLLTLENIIQEWENNNDLWVYSVDLENQCLVPGKISWAGITRKNTDIARIHLDNGSFIDATLDHKFMRRDGVYVEAQNLKEGDALMPLYKRLSDKEAGDRIKGYEKIYDPFKQQYELTHRVNAFNAFGKNTVLGKTTHHIDFNKLNNNPNNLQLLTSAEHFKLHSENMICLHRWNKSTEGRQHSRRIMLRTRAEGKFNGYGFIANWKNKKIRDTIVNKLTLNTTHEFIDHCERIFLQFGRFINVKETEFRYALNDDITFKKWLRDLNPDFKNGYNDILLRSTLQKLLKRYGFKGAFIEFKRYMLNKRVSISEIIDFCTSNNCEIGRKDILQKFNILRKDLEELVVYNNLNYIEFSHKYMKGNARYHSYKNHTVSKIEFLTTKMDTGCITVDDYHNFAVAGDTENYDINSGIFIKNSMEENYFIPIRKGQETRIDTLPSGNITGVIDDIELLRDQLFTALGIPGSYLTNKNSDGEQTSLAQKSMMFARTILRIQNAVVAELRKIAMVHLLTLGYSGDDLLSFKLQLNNPSKLAEMQEFEHWKQKSEVASALSDHNISKNWIMDKIFGFSADEINRNTYEILGDAHFQMLLANIENQSAGGEAGFGGGGGMDLGGGGGAGGIPGLGDMLGGETPQPGGEEEFQNVPGGGNDQGGEFLTPPSNTENAQGRSSSVNMFMTPKSLRPHVTAGSKNKAYVPRDDARNQRLNQINSITGRNSVRGITKNLFPGLDAVRRSVYPEGQELNTSADEELINESEEQLQANAEALKEHALDKKALINQALSNYSKLKGLNRKVVKKGES